VKRFRGDGPRPFMHGPSYHLKDLGGNAYIDGAWPGMRLFTRVFVPSVKLILQSSLGMFLVCMSYFQRPSPTVAQPRMDCVAKVEIDL
jgi:hypothetical protein